MRRLLLSLTLLCAAALGGCAQLTTFENNVSAAYESLTSSKIDYRYALTSVEAFNTLQTAGTAYLRLPRCHSAGATAVCRDPAATKQIVAGFRAGRVARDAVLRYVRDNPCDNSGRCPLMPKSLYDTLSGTVSTLQSVYATYHVNVGG